VDREGGSRGLAAAPPALRLRNVSKSFGSTRALKSVDLDLVNGEVLGILGHNGSGKSTLVGVLTGGHRPDSGAEAWLRGEKLSFPLSRSRIGVGLVAQDLGLIEGMTGLENFQISRRVSPSGHQRYGINWRDERRRAQNVFESYGVEIDLRRPVEELPLLQRAMLAIVRCAEDLREYGVTAERPGIIILDEPTVYLPNEEQGLLRDLVRTSAASGTSVVLVSHDLGFIRDLTQRLIVLRDGVLVAERDTDTTPDDQLVELIVGQKLTITPGRGGISAVDAAGVSSSAVLDPSEAEIRVRGLTGARVRGIDLDMRAGEVVGLAGLLGSGAEDLPYLLFGALAAQDGELTIADITVKLKRLSSDRAIDLGIGLVPADRKTDGLVAEMTIRENMMLLVGSRYYRRGLMHSREADRVAAEICQQFDVRPPDPRRAVGTLSGGNQQKVLIAKWREIAPRLLLLHEPTQGVDVGARNTIHEIVRDMAAKGTTVLWLGSDYEEMAHIADRVVTVSEGTVGAELSGDALTAADITAAVIGARQAMGETHR
jgi:ribose transport system ATP-binding protein